MTKSDLQQELLAKVKPGTKPSHLKKLKRSKSDSDIPQAPPLPNPNPPSQLLQDQLTQKQKEVENLKKKNEQLNSKLTETTQELDNSLLARYEALKSFSKIQDQLQKIKQELTENVDQASDELISQDETITKLRANQQKVQAKIQELQRDLNLTQRLVKLKEFSYPSPENNLDYLKYGLYSLVALVLIL